MTNNYWSENLSYKNCGVHYEHHNIVFQIIIGQANNNQKIGRNEGKNISESFVSGGLSVGGNFTCIM